MHPMHTTLASAVLCSPPQRNCHAPSSSSCVTRRIACDSSMMWAHEKAASFSGPGNGHDPLFGWRGCRCVIEPVRERSSSRPPSQIPNRAEAVRRLPAKWASWAATDLLRGGADGTRALSVVGRSHSPLSLAVRAPTSCESRLAKQDGQDGNPRRNARNERCALQVAVSGLWLSPSSHSHSESGRGRRSNRT
jgi:hypothetical protein